MCIRDSVTSLDYGTDPAIPPVGHMKGVDLVTEGVITMSRVVEYAKAFVEGTDLTNLWSVQTDGACLLYTSGSLSFPSRLSLRL